MRTARIKIPAESAAALYHSIARTVNGEWLFSDSDKEEIRRLVRVVAEGCGVEVIGFVFLDNHLHLLVLVPKIVAISDDELIHRYQLRRPKATKYDVANLEVIRAQLAENHPQGIAWRKRQLALMNDLSQYMKILKQKITTWYNWKHGRYGTIWAERFTSILIENDAQLAKTISVYIDLNPVRANLVSDPKDYRFCSYAEAVAGDTTARKGIMHIMADNDWTSAHAAYRLALFGAASAHRENGRVLPVEDFERVARDGGELSAAAMHTCKIRFLSRSGVLGSEAFVSDYLARRRDRYKMRSRSGPPAMPRIFGYGSLKALHLLRSRPERGNVRPIRAMADGSTN